MVDKERNKKSEQEEAPKIMMKPLPQILDEMDETSGRRRQRESEEAARSSREAATAATKLPLKQEKELGGRKAGEKAAGDATRTAASGCQSGKRQMMQ